MAATSIQGIVDLDPTLMDMKLSDGTTKDGVEYCPYTQTSKKYDTRRVNPGLDILLGNAATSGKPLLEQCLLDVGCGTGSFLAQVKPFFHEVCGVEYNEGMLEQAVLRFGSEVPLLQGSAQNLPYDDLSFDVVCLNQVVHHFDASENFQALSEAIKECFRVLVPNGRLIVNTSTPEQQRDGFWWLSLFPKASDQICARFPPLQTLIDHMNGAGFSTDADGVLVPLNRPLMHPSMYLEGGVDLAFDPDYRACDSSWEMVSQSGELEDGLGKLNRMKQEATADQWLEGREALRKSVGQATFVIAKKPGNELGICYAQSQSDSTYSLSDDP